MHTRVERENSEADGDDSDDFVNSLKKMTR